MSVKLANNFETFLIAFNRYQVDYILTGGYAVIFHGYGRTTGDLDIWIKPSSENKGYLIQAFKALDVPDELIEYIETLDFQKPFAVKLGEQPFQIDIFNAVTGLQYELAKQNTIPFKYAENLEVDFINLPDLITNKMLTGRTKDKADVEELHKINIHSKDKGIIEKLKKLFKRK